MKEQEAGGTLSLPFDVPENKATPKPIKDRTDLAGRFIKTYTDWHSQRFHVKYKFNGSADAKAINEIIEYVREVRTIENKPTDDELVSEWAAFLNTYHLWDDFCRRNLKLTQINYNISNIYVTVHQQQHRKLIFPA
jgi:hypothetical protein